MRELPWDELRARAAHRTELGALVVADALDVVAALPSASVDLVVTSPPYDRQGKYRDGRAYGRDWYEGFFLKLTAEVHRVLAPHGSFVLNYRSKRQGSERGVLQYELVFWLREQGFLFAEDFVWGKPSPPPGRFNRYLKDDKAALDKLRTDANVPGASSLEEHPESTATARTPTSTTKK